MSTRVVRHIILLALIAVAGCTNDPVFPERAISVQATGLPPLDGGAYYQLWISYPPPISHGKQPVPDHNDPQFFSAGRFNMSAMGTITGSDGTGTAVFSIPAGYNPNLIVNALVTVEQGPGAVTTPGARLLEGNFTGTAPRGYAKLLISGADAFATTLDTAGVNQMVGSYMLDAPTGDDTAGYARGIWFVNTSAVPLRSALILPIQPLITTNPAWTYEGWLLHRIAGGQTEYVSLGRFDNPNLRDKDAAGPAAGADTAAAYQFPGGDFVAGGKQRILNDMSYGVVVSVQPAGIPISRPLIVLLQRDTIPALLGRRQNDGLQHRYSDMWVEVTVNR